MNIVLRYWVIAALALSLGVGLAPIIGSHGQNVSNPSPSPSPVPSPDPATMAPAWATGTLVPAPDCSGDTTTTDPGVTHVRGMRCAGQIVTMSDERLNGTSVETVNHDTYAAASGSLVVESGTMQLTNDTGSWSCRQTSLFPSGDMGSDSEMNICVGSDGYEGLSAILVLDWTTCQPQWSCTSSSPVQVKGAIFPGGLPPSP